MVGQGACSQIFLNHALRLELQSLVPKHSCKALSNDHWALFLPGLLDPALTKQGRMPILHLILNLILNLLRLVLSTLRTSVYPAY